MLRSALSRVSAQLRSAIECMQEKQSVCLFVNRSGGWGEGEGKAIMDNNNNNNSTDLVWQYRVFEQDLGFSQEMSMR